MKKFLALMVSAVLLTGLLSGCQSNSADKQEGAGDSPSSGDTIKVGLNYELSGDVATYGQGLVAGIELGLEEINSEGGVLGKQIEAIKADNKSEDTEAANVSARLVTRDHVLALLGPATSGNTKAATPAAMQNKVPLISGSATSDDVTVDSNGNVRDYIFKTCYNDSFQGVMMAELASRDLGAKTAAILGDSTSDYAKGLSTNFKNTFLEGGGKLVAEEAYQAKDTDFKAVLTSLKGQNPDVLFVPGYYEEVGLIIRQARELGLNMPILGADGFESPKLVEIAGKEALNNVFYSSHYSPLDDTAEVNKFKVSFEAKYGHEPDAFNALGYDMAYFLKDGFERAGEANSEKLRDALAETKNFKGVTGVLSVDEKHNPVKSVTIIEVKNGETTFYKKLDPK